MTEKTDILFEERNFQQSLVICKALAEEVSSIFGYIDESGGGMTNTIYFAFETLNKLAGQLVSISKQALFGWAMQEFPKRKYHDFEDGICF